MPSPNQPIRQRKSHHQLPRHKSRLPMQVAALTQRDQILRRTIRRIHVQMMHRQHPPGKLMQMIAMLTAPARRSLHPGRNLVPIRRIFAHLPIYPFAHLRI